MSDNYTTMIRLPGALLYSESHPEYLEDIELSMLTTKDEKKIYGSVNYKTLQGIIQSNTKPNVDINHLSLPDAMFMIIMLRIHTYGTKYYVNTGCPVCGSVNTEFEVDLNDMTLTDMPEDLGWSQEITLPVSEDTVLIQNLTFGELDQIGRRAEQLASRARKPSSEFAYVERLTKIIKEVNGEVLDLAQIKSYVEDLVSVDLQYINHKLDQMDKYGYTMEINSDCPRCGSSVLVPFKWQSDFFRAIFD